MNQQPSQKQVQQILSSEEGQQLIQLFTASGASLKEAQQAVKEGNQARAKQIMAPILNRPEVQSLLKQLERSMTNGQSK